MHAYLDPCSFNLRSSDMPGQSQASRFAMAEWYIASWKLDPSLVFLRSCFAFSSVKQPGANLDLGPAFRASGPDFSGRSPQPSGAAVGATWVGSEGHPKSGAHQFVEAGFGSGFPDEGGDGAGIPRAGVKDGSGVDIATAIVPEKRERNEREGDFLCSLS